jgi:hypothetical protein
MKKFSMIMILVAGILAMFTMVNAETPSAAEPFPVAQTGTKKSCCANKQKPEEKKCDMTKEECEKSKCKREE